jgi:1-deoxy-D-xylulose-5-phosphate reductoisomerase
MDHALRVHHHFDALRRRGLFSAPPERIEVVVHPQSVIHSMVQYRDGSVMAQLGSPDMRTPIACALAWPERIEAGVGSLDFFSLSNLTFEAPDLERFPCLKLAFDVLRLGGDAPAVLNAANEVAVDAFLNGRLRFIDIPAVVSAALDGVSLAGSDSVEALLAKDEEARAFALQQVAAC